MNRIIIQLTFLSCFTFILSINSLFAQQYQPFPTDSASWDVGRCFYLFSSGWYDHHDIYMDGSDTMYAAQQFKKLFVIDHQAHGAWDSIYPVRFFGGIRESGKQVFIFQSWATVDTSVHLVYDFNKTNVGDTIYTSCLAGLSSTMLPHEVKSVDSVMVGSKYHKRLYLEEPGNPMNNEFWIEGVGSSWGLPYASFWSITDNSYDLICYNEFDLLKYSNPNPTFGFCTPPLPAITCDTIITALEKLAKIPARFKLYPNPGNNIVSIEYPHLNQGEKLVFIYSVLGEMLITERLTGSKSELDVKALADGVYFVVLKSQNLIETKRLLIQH